MTASHEPQPPRALVAAWCVLGCAGILALLGASAGISIVLVVPAAYVVVAHRDRARQKRATGDTPVRRTGLSSRLVKAPGGALVVPPTPAGRAKLERVADAGRMTDVELCRAWRVSYVRLRRLQQLPHLSEAAAGVAMERSRFLDELERRSPQGFAAWMAAGARAPSDPSRYLIKHTSALRPDPNG